MPSVLFVCTANRFRSPVAAAIFKRALIEEKSQRTSSRDIEDPKEWSVGSAGVQAIDGETVLPEVLETARQLGINLSNHHSARINGSLLSDYDLILVMEKSHKDAIDKEFPHVQEYVYLLSQVVNYSSNDIPDVYDTVQEVVGVVAGMNELIRRNLRYICTLAIALHNKRNRQR